MRRFTGLEIGILALASVFILCGMVSVVDPKEAAVFHMAYRWVQSSVEYVSKTGGRFYGALAILIGIGLGWMVLQGPRQRP